MRLLGYELRRLQDRGGEVRTRSHTAVRSVPPAPLGRLASVALAGSDRAREMDLYRELRRLLPIVDAAIHRLTRLIGTVRVESTAGVIEDIEGFLRHVPVNGLQRGFDVFLANHIGQMLLYGCAGAEVVPETGRRGVRALLNLDSRYLRVLEDNPPLKLGIGYQPPGTREPIRIPPSLALYSVNAPEGDAPYGTSLLRSVPFVARLVLTMERALEQTWERMGAPSYKVTWNPPADFVDPDGERTREIMKGIEDGFTSAMQARHDTGLVSDFFAAGDVTAEILGAGGSQLEFRETYRALTEQIVARTGLPPFMLGLSWATTERMSQQQADLLINEVKHLRRQLEPMVEQLIDLWMVLVRRRARFRVRWSEVSLQDLKDTADAVYRRAMARKADVEALTAMVERGWATDEFAREQLFPSARYEVMDEPPEPVLLPAEEGPPIRDGDASPGPSGSPQ
jgi:hypothetical protein